MEGGKEHGLSVKEQGASSPPSHSYARGGFLQAGVGTRLPAFPEERPAPWCPQRGRQEPWWGARRPGCLPVIKVQSRPSQCILFPCPCAPFQTPIKAELTSSPRCPHSLPSSRGTALSHCYCILARWYCPLDGSWVAVLHALWELPGTRLCLPNTFSTSTRC